MPPEKIIPFSISGLLTVAGFLYPNIDLSKRIIVVCAALIFYLGYALHLKTARIKELTQENDKINQGRAVLSSRFTELNSRATKYQEAIISLEVLIATALLNDDHSKVKKIHEHFLTIKNTFNSGGNNHE